MHDDDELLDENDNFLCPICGTPIGNLGLITYVSPLKLKQRAYCTRCGASGYVYMNIDVDEIDMRK